MAEEQASGIAVNVATWTQPKTDWKKDDKFNFVDYNRIKNNLVYLANKASNIVQNININDMGADITKYTAYWDVSVFNDFESNLEKIAKYTYGNDYGAKQTFYPNGVFIKYDELNRIETAILDIYESLENHEKGLRKMPFILGRFREVRI